MSAGARYGGFLGLIIAATYFAGPRIQAALFVLLALQSALFVVVVWNRTRLPFVTLAGIFATFSLGCGAVVFYRGLDIFTLSIPVVVFCAGAVAVPILFAIESRVHSAEWKAWDEHMKTVSVLDMLKGRHVPRLVKG